MSLLHVVGIGPGSRDYLIPKAVDTVNNAQVLVGGKRALALFPEHRGEKMVITGDLPKVIAFIRSNLHKEIAVLVSGDPGFHSLLPIIRKSFPGERIQVIPGISSVQLAYARLALPWQDATLLSLHGKELSILKEYLTAPNLALLTDPVNSPSQIAAYWLENGGTDCTVYLCEHLSYEDENVQPYLMSALANQQKTTPCVMVIKNEQA